MNDAPRILVTYDGSDASRSVFSPALDLAQRLGASLVLLRVHVAPSRVWTHPDDVHRQQALAALQQEWQTELDAVAAELRGSGVAVDAQARALGQRWSVSDEVLAVADEIDAYLIAIATHGESTFRRFFIGSTAQSILARSKRPVLFLNVSA